MNMPVKAVASSGATGLGGAIVIIFIAYFGTPTAGGVAPEIFASALTTVVCTILAGLGAYFPKMEGQSS